MLKKALTISRHTLRTLLEIMVGVVVALAIILGVLTWQFSKGPVDVSWIKPYLQSAITDGDPNLKLEAGAIIAEWPNLTGAFTLGVSDFKLISQNRTVLDIDSVGIRLSKPALLIGIIAPESIIINQPSLKIMRGRDGQFHLSLLQDNDNSAEPTQLNFKNLNAETVISSLFLDDRGLAPSLWGAWSDLENFTLSDAYIITEDHISGVTWVMTDVTASLTRSRKSIALDVNFISTAGNRSTTAAANLTAQKTNNHKVNFDLTLKQFDMSLLSNIMSSITVFSKTTANNFALNGNIKGVVDQEWMIEKIDGTIKADTFGDQLFSIKAEREGNIVPLILSLKSIEMKQIQAVYPKGLDDLNITDWLTNRLSGGVINNISFVAPFVQDPKTKKWGVQNPRATFDFSNMKVDYNAPLPPILSGSGTARIENDTLRINVGSGDMGGLLLRGGSVEITNLTKPEPTMVIIDAKTEAPLGAILNYIYTDPINLDDTLTLDPKTSKGNAVANVKVTLPTHENLKKEEVDVTVSATLDNALIPNIVKGLDITGGPFTITVQNGEFRFAGTGALGGRTATLDYKEFLNHDTAPYIADLNAKIDTDEALRKAFGADLSLFVTGAVPADIKYKQNKNDRSVIDISANVTNAKLHLDAVRYQKPVGTAGFATARVLLNNQDVEKIENLVITTGNDKIVGALNFSKNSVLAGGDFPSVKLGAHDFALNFKQPSPNNFIFNAKGAVIDARPFLKNKTPKAAQRNTAKTPAISAVINASTPILRGGDAPDQILKNATINLELDKNADMKFFNLTASTNGAPVSVSIKPDANNRRILTANTKNAGGLLYALDIYKTMRGGELSLNAAQINGAGINDFRGSGYIQNFTITKAPVLAQLVNVFSLSGITSLLSNEGISFKKIRADFDWRNSQNGRIISVRNGKTSGASIGLTFGGILNQDTGKADLSGKVVPISDVNKVVSQIPIVGELLTGGKDGGIIAATYAIKGDTNDPKVIVNPLSVLAPGFLRSIFFENSEINSPSRTPPQKRGFN